MGGQDDFYDVDLEEDPNFDLGDGEPFLDFEGEEESGGVSRTFRIVGLIMLLGVIGIVVVLVLLAISGGDELTDNQKTSTAAVSTNTAVAMAYNSTLTAIAISERASQTAAFNFDMTATAAESTLRAQQTQTAEAIAAQRTAEFFSTQTQEALDDIATQDALDLTATAVENNRLDGTVIDTANDVIFGNATLRLYKDDGDGQFDPVQVIQPNEPEETEEAPIGIVTAVPSGSGTGDTGETAGTAGDEGGAEAGDSGEPGAATEEAVEEPLPNDTLPINYGETVQGTLQQDQAARWAFTGSAGDTVIINTVASDSGQMDLFIELYGPDDMLLIGDDDSGSENNAAISSFELPADGMYTIEVTSSTGPGAYTLALSRGLSTPGDAVPTQETSGASLMLAGYSRNTGRSAVLQGGTPVPGDGDELIDETTTDASGFFDFGSLEPGIYWLELDYASLPPDLQALVSPDAPVFVRVDVPVTGEFTFTVSGPTPTPPGPDPIELTETARAMLTQASPGGIETLTPSPEVVGTLSPEALPTTGFFSDIGDKAGDLGGSSGLAVLAIAAMGLVAVVFIARKLRTSV